MTADYIAWAQFWCPEPIATSRASFRLACAAYDEVDNRLGNDAEHDDFMTRILWLETAIRLARLGWGIIELENARWSAATRMTVEGILADLTDTEV